MREIVWNMSTWKGKSFTMSRAILCSAKEDRWCASADKFLLTEQGIDLETLPSSQDPRSLTEDEKFKYATALDLSMG